ncbi:MAG: Ribosomal RNA small subunit methyltransferase A [Chlamydiae bacterium]|nr:Ribosomal RNA small subunit methyltransferase A [Chlamydiota bacterium]
MPIYRPTELHQLGVRAKRRLSQNFLIDRNILQKICTTAEIKQNDTVLEIGPGPGALTEALLEKGARVIAVEKDPELAEKLHRFDSKNLEIICGDALTFPFDDIPAGTKVVANLPYHITTPLIGRLIVRSPQIHSLTVMVQKEVGLRMCARENTAMYSSFTVFLKAYSTPTFGFTVKPRSFFPVPSVHSCVVHLRLHPFAFPFSEEAFFQLTRTAFGKRRKMITTSLKSLFSQEKIRTALVAISKKPTARPQELSLAEFGALFSEINSH